MITRDDAIRKMMMKRDQLVKYRDEDCQGEDAKRIIDVRISQLDLDLLIVTKIVP